MTHPKIKPTLNYDKFNLKVNEQAFLINKHNIDNY